MTLPGWILNKPEFYTFKHCSQMVNIKKKTKEKAHGPHDNYSVLVH